MSAPGDQLREYLTGDVLGQLEELLQRAAQEVGAKVRLALYELNDQELEDVLIAHKDRIQLILANSSKERHSNAWDVTNHSAMLLSTTRSS
jgi:hypothetical protein